MKYRGDFPLTFNIVYGRIGGWLQRSRLYTNTAETVGSFDRFCRYFFPTTFSVINIVYWVLYLSVL